MSPRTPRSRGVDFLNFGEGWANFGGWGGLGLAFCQAVLSRPMKGNEGALPHAEGLWRLLAKV